MIIMKKIIVLFIIFCMYGGRSDGQQLYSSNNWVLLKSDIFTGTVQKFSLTTSEAGRYGVLKYTSVTQQSSEFSDKFYDPSNFMRFGIKVTQHFNYPILHTSPTSSIKIKNHNPYFGPEFNLILQQKNDSTDEWVPEKWGFNLGYRYLIPSESKKNNIFIQMNFSFYRVKYSEYNQSTANTTEKKKMIVENTGGFGINHRFTKNFEIFGGLGVGSTSGFFPLFKHFIPHSFLGVGYQIN